MCNGMYFLLMYAVYDRNNAVRFFAQADHISGDRRTYFEAVYRKKTSSQIKFGTFCIFFIYYSYIYGAPYAAV